MKITRKLFLFILILMMIPLFAFAETVVTSFYPIWLIGLNLADGIPELEIKNLAAPDTGCLHDYQLQTGDMKVLSKADLFMINGAGMESYLDLVFSAFPDLPVASAAEGVPLLYETDALQIGENENESEEMANAHIWLSVSNEILMSQNLAGAMIQRFPLWKDRILSNLDAYTRRMESLDLQLKEGLSDLPHTGMITFHEAFPYFADAYGLKVLAVVNREPGETLTPSQLALLVDTIRDLDTPPLFVEPQFEDLSARTLAQETGARIYTLDPVVTGPEENVPLDYYETVMLENMKTLQEAFNY